MKDLSYSMFKLVKDKVMSLSTKNDKAANMREHSNC